MESSSPPPDQNAAVSAILARAEQAVARAGDRILVERLHQALDTDGTTGIAALAQTLLPLLHALVIVLPRAITEGASPAVLTAAQTLGTAVQERGISLPALSAEGMHVHDRLLEAIHADLRADDRALVAAMTQISHVLLEVERAVLLAYQEAASAALVRSALVDPETGLASRWYFDERLAAELELSRRKERPLVLGLVAAETTHERRLADLLRTQIRSSDLATRRTDGLFILLLLETTRAAAAVLLGRLAGLAAAEEPPLRFRVGVAASPEHGVTADALTDQAQTDLNEQTRE